MKKLILLFVVLGALGCQSGPGLIPLEEGKPENPGDAYAVDISSRLIQQRFEYLQDYLAEHRPDLLPLELAQAYAQDVDGINTALYCVYQSAGKETWLKALLLGDDEGQIVGTQITAQYDINELQ